MTTISITARASRRRAPIRLVALVLAALGPSTALADPPNTETWRVVFADEFSGTAVDTVKWATQYQWGPTHNHAAYMQAGNVEVENGAVSLVGRRESVGGKQFISGILSSHDTFRLTDGYIEARIKMPTTRGSWPAFWMLDNGWPPEIDIMEYPLFVGQTTNDTYATNNFWGTQPNQQSDFDWHDTNINLSADYHTYGLRWDATGLHYYFDGSQIKSSSDQAQFQNMYIMFNYAIGGWPVHPTNPDPPSTAVWPAGHVDQTEAEWIRVWKAAPTSATSTWTFTAATNGSWDAAANWSGSVPNFERQSVVLPTLAGRSAMEIRWGDSRTVGSMTLNGDTAYTLGQASGSVESIMFADRTDAATEITVALGSGGHVFNSRIDLWSSLSVRNDTAGAVTFNGDIIGQARLLNGRYVGGQLRLFGIGSFNLNGNGYYQLSTLITQGVTVNLNGQLYADANVVNETRVQVDLGSTLNVVNADGAFGGLPTDPNRFIIDGGRIGITASGNLTRGFTIGSGGAMFDVAADVGFRLAVHRANPNATIESNSGGNLIMTGAGTGSLQKPLGGNGGVLKNGAGTWVISSTNSYSGQTSVEEGLLNIAGTTGTGDTIVEAAGTLIGNGQVLGNLAVDGHVAPGESAGILSVAGNYVQNAAGSLDIELGGTAAGLFDVLNIAGSAALEGALNISLINGFTPSDGELFPILNAAEVTGTLSLTGQAAGLSLLPTDTGLALFFGALPPGDYDRNGIVNAADYDVWSAAFGSTESLAADGNQSGQIDAADYVVWRKNIGASVFNSGSGADSAAKPAPVPEPSALVLACCAALTVIVRRASR